VQISRPGVVAQTLPQRQHCLQIRLGEVPHRRELRHEAVEEGLIALAARTSFVIIPSVAEDSLIFFESPADIFPDLIAPKAKTSVACSITDEIIAAAISSTKVKPFLFMF
jgi:hypothetical protein